MSVIDKIVLNGITYELGGSSGEGLSTDLKAAMDQIAQKVAYIDSSGQTYYNALHSALYPPANLSYITAVYTQSGTVYNTDSLDTLRANLVVTAHYSNGTTSTVSAYTLSGTLTVGTSTITAAYGGKTATFNVTVTERPEEALYPLPDVDNYTATYQTLSVSNGNHLIRSTDSNSRVCYIASTGAKNNNSSSPTMFTINAGNSYSLTLKNINVTENSVANNYTLVGFLPSGTSMPWDDESDSDLVVKVIFESTGASTPSNVTITGTASEDISITAVGLMDYRSIDYTMDIELRVNGTRYI